MTLTSDLDAIKARQQQTWSSGDFSVVASRIVYVSEQLAESCDLRAGSRVLDVAAGNGNATLAAARSGTHAIGVDYVPALIEDARVRAAAEGLDVEFRVGDAEDLPIDDDSVDAVLSVFGVMFAPNHERSAREITRVARSGATVGLASWTPDGFIGDMFRVISAHVPPPAGVPSPLLWGTVAHLQQLFGDVSDDITSVERTYTFRFTSASEFVAFFRRWYGPTVSAFAALDVTGREALTQDLVALAERADRHRDGGSVALPATYLESVFTVR
jgi:ubiquinone/menaquinone biosynthesis C-methylase UbiE